MRGHSKSGGARLENFMMSEQQSTLLPNGLKDLLPPEAEAEAQAVNTLMTVFQAFGYQRVKPPMVEFEESLLAPGPGQALATNTFRLMDPVSQKMMGVRADTTAQIARIAESRMKEEVRPLRISYAADVLRVNGTQLRPERQFCQVGCEFIGTGSQSDDVEVALIAIKALSEAGIKGLSIDLTVPTLVQHIYAEHKVAEKDQAALNEALERRDQDAVKRVSGKAADILNQLMNCSGRADKALAALSKVKVAKDGKRDIQALEKTCRDLQKALAVYGLEEAAMTIDPVERRGFEYQTGVSFTLFARDVRGELGRGGRYDIHKSDGSAEPATGFTLYMDTLRRAITGSGDQKSIYVPAGEGWAQIKTLQDDGWTVRRGGSDKNCTHVYKNGRIEEKKKG